MNTFTRAVAGGVVGLVLSGCSSYHIGKHDTKLRAKAVIAGPALRGRLICTKNTKGGCGSS